MKTRLPSASMLLGVLVLTAGVLLSCSSKPEPSPTPSVTPPVVLSPIPLSTPTVASPVPSPSSAFGSPAGPVQVIVVSTDLAVGHNRFVFGLLDREITPVRVAQARASFLDIDATPQKVTEQTTAVFTQWPSSRAGVYVAEVSFDHAGRWGVIVEVERDGVISLGQSGFIVQTESSSPAIGSPAPRSVNRTAADVADLEELTSSPVPDPDLYRTTIAEAASSGRPTVVTFATPAFCQTATCGPQVEVVSSIKDRYKATVNFIHVEVYDNPHEMAGDFSKGRISPLVEEWGLLAEPFTFVLDSEGLVAFKFEGFVTEGELEPALRETLAP